MGGGAGNDTLRGGAGDDYLGGDSGDDFLEGGQGNDQLYGGTGANIYYFAPGFGQDYIVNAEGNQSDSGVDVIQFGPGILPSDVIVGREDSSSYDFQRLLLSVRGTTDTVVVQDYFKNDGNTTSSIATIAFADGTVWDFNAVMNQMPVATNGNDRLYGYDMRDDVIDGGAGNDRIYGFGGNDHLIGGDGDDQLDGGEGDDRLEGGSGNDYLQGGAGNNFLDGGAGDDELRGGSGADYVVGGSGNDSLARSGGADTYYFESGFGQDTLYSNYVPTSSYAEVVQFGPGILPSDIVLNHSITYLKENLILSIQNSTDSLYLWNFFSPGYKYDNTLFKFADGTTWDFAAISSRATFLNSPPALTGTKAYLPRGTEDTAYSVTQASQPACWVHRR